MFNPNIDEFIKNYELLKSSRKMGNLYKVDKATILNFANKINYKNQKELLLSNEQIKYILSSYNITTSSKLAEELNVSVSSIKRIWRINNLKGKSSRLYYMNFDYFNTIDSKDKAYFLGIIAADGCVYKRKNHEKMLSFTFHIQEKNIIYDFLKYTKSTYVPIETKNRIALQINSNKICEDLFKYNITSKKTWTYKPYELNDDLMIHYLRGYFDGDGSIYYIDNKINTPSKWFIHYCGNKHTMEIFKSFFLKHDIEFKIYQDKREYTNDFYNLRLRKNSEKLKFIKLIYNNSEGIRLNRKYDKAMYLYNLLTPSNLEIN